MSQAAEGKVFISYKHGTEEHNTRVRRLVDMLESVGVSTIFDEYDLEYGQNLHHFMEQCRDDNTKKVLVLCTPKYAASSDDFEGGVGAEGQLLRTFIYEHPKQTTVLPIFFDEDRRLPKYMESCFALDMSTNELLIEKLPDLVRWINDEPKRRRPVPSSSLKTIASDTSAQIDLSDITSAQYIDFIDTFCEDVASKINEVGFEWVDSTAESLDAAIDKLMPLREFCAKTIIAAARDIEEPEKLVKSIIETVHNKFMTLQDVMRFCRKDYSHVSFFVWEFFLTAICVLMRYEKYSSIAALLQDKYSFGRHHYMYGDCGLQPFVYIRPHTEFLKDNFKYPDNQKYVSYAAWKLREREFAAPLSFEKLRAADIILCQISCIYYRFERISPWYPLTAQFSRDNSDVMEFWRRLSSRKACQALMPIFNVQDLPSLKNLVDENKSNEKLSYINQQFFFDFIPNIADVIANFGIGERA